MRTRGFTLLEQLLVLAILAILVSGGVVHWRQATSATQSRALAESVAQILRSARQRAVAHHVPVAVGLSDSGGQGTCQSVYFLEGEKGPRITRVVHFGRELPQAVIFQGAWGQSSLIRPRCGDRSDTFVVDQWSHRSDLLLTFLPNGQLVSNEGVWADGEIRLLTSLGLQVSPAALSSSLRTLYTPVRVSRPYTIHLNVTGSVWVSNGVEGAEIAESPQPLGFQFGPSSPRKDSASNQAPQIDSVDLLPEPNPGNTDAVTNLRVGKDEYVAMTVYAQDPDGDQLQFRWKCSAGAFTSADWRPMNWDEELGRWKSTWIWQPPEVGDTFRLEGEVRDLRGGVVQTTSRVVRTIGRGADTRALFQRGLNLYTVPLHGSGTRQLPVTGSMATWTGDGTRILYYGGNSLIPWLCNRDGSGPSVVYDHYGGYPCYSLSSPFGERILSTTFGTPARMWVSDADGGGQSELNLSGLPQPSVVNLPDWSPDGEHLLFAWANPNDQNHYKLARYDFSTDSVSLISAGSDDYTWPVWSTDSQRLAYVHRPNVGPARLELMNSDGTGIQVLASLQSTNHDSVMLSWSPDGTRLVYCDDQDVWSLAIHGGGPVNLSNHPASDSKPSWSRDGRVLFLSDRNGGPRLFLVSAQGGSPLPLTGGPGTDSVHPSKGAQDRWF